VGDDVRFGRCITVTTGASRQLSIHGLEMRRSAAIDAMLAAGQSVIVSEDG
jgi:hypothetical protein